MTYDHGESHLERKGWDSNQQQEPQINMGTTRTKEQAIYFPVSPFSNFFFQSLVFLLGVHFKASTGIVK